MHKDNTLYQCGIEDGSIISVHQNMQVIINNSLNLERIALDVHSKMRVSELKQKIFEKKGYRPSEQRLIFDKEEMLINGKTLEEYGIAYGDIITLCVVFIGGMQVFVKMLNGKCINIDVYEDEKVTGLKEKIQNEEGYMVEKQRLIFCGNALENDKTLKEFGILRESTLNLILSP